MEIISLHGDNFEKNEPITARLVCALVGEHGIYDKYMPPREQDY